MSFSAVTCQNYFFRPPLVLFSAVLRIRLILVFCVTLFLLWIQGETTHFLQTVFYYVPLGQSSWVPSKRKWHGFLLPLDLWLQSLDLPPGIDRHLQVFCRDFKYIPEAWTCCSSFSVTSLLAGSWWSAAQTGIQSGPLHTWARVWILWVWVQLVCVGGKCLQALSKAVLKCNSPLSLCEEPQCFSEKSQQARCG